MAPSSGTSEAQTKVLAELIAPECEDALAVSAMLLSAFGSLSRVMTAPREAIARQTGQQRIGRLIAAAQNAVVAGQKDLVVNTPFDMRDERILRYVHGLFQGLAFERLQVFFLDRANRYLTDERMTDGSGFQVSGTLYKMVARAIDLGAGVIVLAHNHPSGKADASHRDIATTTKIAQSLSDLGLHLADHLIVAGNKVFSMRGAGLL